MLASVADATDSESSCVHRIARLKNVPCRQLSVFFKNVQQVLCLGGMPFNFSVLDVSLERAQLRISNAPPTSLTELPCAFCSDRAKLSTFRAGEDELRRVLVDASVAAVVLTVTPTWVTMDRGNDRGSASCTDVQNRPSCHHAHALATRNGFDASAVAGCSIPRSGLADTNTGHAVTRAEPERCTGRLVFTRRAFWKDRILTTREWDGLLETFHTPRLLGCSDWHFYDQYAFSELSPATETVVATRFNGRASFRARRWPRGRSTAGNFTYLCPESCVRPQRYGRSPCPWP